MKNPKVSIISAVYNREKYLIRFINSIQKQKFNDVEIIFIDDFSEDNSIKIIENSQQKDKRILLIKNKKNKGTFICRNLGVLKSRGEYLLLPDPDDIISQDIIDMSYKLSKKKNYEMIRFNIYIGNGKIFLNNIVKNLQSRPIFQPELSMYLVYGLGKLRLTDYNVSNKFVKRVAFIRALNCLYKYYLKIYMVECEDGLMNYFLYRTVKSFYFLKKIGYYYIYNKKTNKERQTRILKKLKFQFLYLKIVFEFTKKTLLEKNICNAILNFIEYYNKQINFSLKNKKDFQFYNDIINTYLNSSFINANNKNYLSKIRNVINNKIKNII
jgi:glycosyltransferase involved in cell wall biosynthesis